MKIAVIGSGNVGSALARTWAAAGHEVVFAARDLQSDKLKRALAEAGAHVRAVDLHTGVAAAEVVVLATPWAGTESAIKGAGDLSGKVLVDATNAVPSDLNFPAVGGDTSAAEMIADWATGARVVKAFNSVGYNVMGNTDFDGQRADAYICGDDAEAKQLVGQLAEAAGFEVVDCGPLIRARLLEPFALLWINLAIAGQSRELAFKLLRR